MSKSGLATLIIPALAILAMAAMPAVAQAADDTVKLFVMAGQSNAEGKAKTDLWDYQAEAPDTKDFFAHFRKDGKWIVRDDVFIKFLGRHGNLTVGYGSPGCTSSELEFGFILGDYGDHVAIGAQPETKDFMLGEFRRLDPWKRGW